MFSRAAKSVVKSLGQRKYYAGEDNLKITLIGTIEGVHNLKTPRISRYQYSTLNTIPIYDVASINKRFLFTQNRSHHFNKIKPFCHENSRMLTLMGKSRSYESTSKQDSTTMKEKNRLSYLTDHRNNVNEINNEKLVEMLHRLPIGEEVGSINQRFATEAGDTCTGKLRSMMTRILHEMMMMMGHYNGTRQICQKNDIHRKIITDCLLQPSINPIEQFANATTTFSVSSSKKNREKSRKFRKKMMSKRSRKKKVQKLAIVTAPFVKVTIHKKSEIGPNPTLHLTNEQKVKIRSTNKRVKKNNDNEFKKQLRIMNVKNDKSKDWTVPAAFSNNKPRLLHDFSKINDKARSSWFISKIFEDRNTQNDHYENLKRFVTISSKIKPKFSGIVKDDLKCITNCEQVSIKDDDTINLKSQSVLQIVPLDYATLPMKDLQCHSREFIDDISEIKTNIEMQDETENIPIEESMVTDDLNHSHDENKESLLCSQTIDDEKENNFYEKWRPVEKVSSNVRHLLDNARRKKIIEKSSSNSSIGLYHLDDFFKMNSLSADTSENLFLDVNKEDLHNNWLTKNLYLVNDHQNSNDPCRCLKERQGISFSKNRDPCGKPDPCKKDPSAKPDPCKKDPSSKPDPCKKDPSSKPDPCKKDPSSKPDPCKRDPSSKPDPCKKDPSSKPDPCKKDPSSKPDPCKKDPSSKPDPCKKDPSSKPDPCKKDPSSKPDPCKKDPSSKPDPCKKDPSSKPDPCKKDRSSKPDPCKKDRSSKPDPCAKPDSSKKDPCGKPDPCAKPDSSKKDPCGKPDPCLKKSPCSTSDSRPKRNSCKTEKTDKSPDCTDKKTKKQCPPVIRAPGCPDDTKKGGKICKVSSMYYFKDELLYEKLFKMKYVKFNFPNRNVSTNEIDDTKKSNVKIRTNMELPKLYTLDTFGINYNTEDY